MLTPASQSPQSTEIIWQGTWRVSNLQNVNDLLIGDYQCERFGIVDSRENSIPLSIDAF